MLKTKFNDSIRLVTQPNHAVAAGYMASHWGNKEFTKLGFYDNCSEPDIEIDVKSFQIDTRTVIAVSVKEGKNKPYLLMGKSAYKRVMKDDYALSRHDFDEIYSKKQQPQDESGFAL